MSETPRTDSAVVEISCDDSCCAIYVKTRDGESYDGELVTREAAVMLECELSAANADCKHQREVAVSAIDNLAIVQNAYDAATARADKAEAALTGALASKDRLRKELELQTQDYDNYGVAGSTFRICTYCGVETGAGLFDKGFKHEATCILYDEQKAGEG